MTQRGYPIGSFDQQTADLSVEHADVLDHYRRANEIAENNKRGRATTAFADRSDRRNGPKGASLRLHRARDVI